MPHAQDEKPQRLQSDKLVLEELQDELMIYDPDRHKAFCLNQSAAFVWKHLDGKRTIAEIVDLMGEHFHRPVNEQIVWSALDVLSKDGLLAPSAVHPAVPTGVTRRALLQKFSAGATAAVPVVTVLFVAPTKAHASSTMGRYGNWDNADRNHRHDGTGSLWNIVKGWL